jgi:hypothetical protein
VAFDPARQLLIDAPLVRRGAHRSGAQVPSSWLERRVPVDGKDSTFERRPHRVDEYFHDRKTRVRGPRAADWGADKLHPRDFGAAGEGFLRFCSVSSDDAIRGALGARAGLIRSPATRHHAGGW